MANAPLAAAQGWPAGGWGEPHLNIVARTPEESARIAGVTAPPAGFTAPEPFESRPAGAATHFVSPTGAPFSLPSANMAAGRKLDFHVGNGFFRKLWAAAPSSTTASDGLGPLYNARACDSCHIGDGRGHAPAGPADTGVSLVLKLSVPDALSALTAHALTRLGAAPEPIYGTQLQDRSVAGVPAEGRVATRWTEVPVELGDATAVTLRAPSFSIADAAYGPLHPQARVAARIAPPMIGLGLLEAIPEADILARADPGDADGDGISGRPNRVWSLEYRQWMLGRFGWKAGQPTVAQQSSDAFFNDIGISTPLHAASWGNCTASQTACRAAPHGTTGNGEGLEIPAAGFDLVAYYARNLAVPARRDVDTADTLHGKRIFHDIGCAACHVPKFVTHRLSDRPEQSFQLVWPYSDLLLHDMGDGLADERAEFAASGREWRTPPLWGIGLAQRVSPEAGFLHDGRARTLLEAVLWHGGEAEPAREAARNLPQEDRAALIAFLNSL
ncbi:di-heme oxidoredictase family protein [Tropicimonas sp.]|uniref:di-heme oxidoreductase family protein n=1 Tax=Tropicimonas sp. TaxID=2067044 RepID=UPI003A86096A